MTAPPVWAWAEGDAEVVGEAAELAEAAGRQTWAVAVGADPGRLAAAGADRVLVLDAPYDAETHGEVVGRAVAAAGTPAVVLLPGTADGVDLAPRLAVLLDAVCLLDCAWLRPSGDALLAGRWAYDDRALQVLEVPAGAPLVAVLRHGSRGAPPARPRPLKVERLPAPAGPARARRLRRLPLDSRSVRLAEADRIVAAGLGVGSPEALPAVQELADLLGAALGASRALADRGWVPFERQIGTTGQQVSPSLYLAIGISGAAQHLGGLRDAETVVAINTDPACPMMARAAVAAVGDAAELVPALVRRLRAAGGRGA